MSTHESASVTCPECQTRQRFMADEQPSDCPKCGYSFHEAEHGDREQDEALADYGAELLNKVIEPQIERK